LQQVTPTKNALLSPKNQQKNYQKRLQTNYLKGFDIFQSLKKSDFFT
jgi:hypothetical protein